MPAAVLAVTTMVLGFTTSAYATDANWTLDANYPKNARINPSVDLTNTGGKTVTASNMILFNQGGVQQGTKQICVITTYIGSPHWGASSVSPALKMRILITFRFKCGMTTRTPITGNRVTPLHHRPST